MENLLYYPYINIPKSDWIARTLLYYDKIGSIVPQSYSDEPDNLDSFMRKMVQNDLVKLIDPIKVLNNPWEISQPFIEYLESEEFKIAKRQQAIRNGKFEKIHVDKFDGEIFYLLEQVGLATRLNYEWFRVESRTADDLMTFLASVIGCKLHYQPATDKIRGRHKIIPERKKDYESYKRQNNKREHILNELIPFPDKIDIYKLRKFKDKHKDLLKAFKNKVELIVLNPSIDEASPLFSEMINELKIRKEELTTKMNESKLGGIFFGTICGIIGSVIGLASANTSEAMICGLPGFANAVYSALQIERAEDTFDQSGMKYLALLDKRLSKSAANK